MDVKTIRKALEDIKYTLKLPLELRGKFETSTRSAICQIYTLLEALSTIEADAKPQEPSEDYIAWLRYIPVDGNLIMIETCSPNDSGSFKVYRRPIVEAPRNNLQIIDLVRRIRAKNRHTEVGCHWNGQPQGKKNYTLTEDQSAALITAHDEAIRRECADNWEREWWGFPAMSLEKLNERASDEQRDDIRAYRSAIMGKEAGE